MNPHVIELLAAYHDGELTADRQRLVENHLQDCASCRAELDALETLSSFLQADPVPDRTPAERFAAQVQLRLPRAALPAARQKDAQLPRWVLALPLALVFTWAFMQAALWVTAIILAVGQVFVPHAAFFNNWLTNESLFETSINLLLFNIILLIGTTIFWSAWMAFWLAWNKNQNFEISSNRL